ncbi:hypothetical protein V1527DRAFT_484735 [Lipomyces starkeyi]
MAQMISSAALKDHGVLDWNPVHHRLRCNGHIINIAVQAFLFACDKEAIDEVVRQAEIEDIPIDENLAQQMKQKTKSKASGWRQFGGIGKIHNIAVDIRSSTRLYNEFISLAGKALGLDNDTGWNSSYVLITTALEPKVRVALHQYLDRHYELLRDDFLTPEDWRALEDTAGFLKPFYRATLESEGDFDSIDKTMMTMDILVAHYRRSAVYTTLLDISNCHVANRCRKSIARISGCTPTSW